MDFEPGEVMAMATGLDPQNDRHLVAQVQTNAGTPVLGRLIVDGGENGDEGRVRFVPDANLRVDWWQPTGPGLEP